jgi:hypothetical protein
LLIKNLLDFSRSRDQRVPGSFLPSPRGNTLGWWLWQVSLTNFLDKFAFSCVLSKGFPWQVHLLVRTVKRFSLTNLPSRAYCQKVFLDKFTFSCVLSKGFPWQVYLLVRTVKRFSLTSLPSRANTQQVFLDKFTFSCVQYLTSLLSRVYSQQVSLYKFTFSCVQSTSFPWQVSRSKFCWSCARNVGKHLSRVKVAFCLPKTMEVFLVHLSSFPWRSHEQIFLVQKLAWLVLEPGSLARKKLSNFCLSSKTCKGVIWDGPYWTSRKNSLEFISLSSLNQISLF